tara:strand:+ start:394 stop:801 length:408 start_codon:yes stop_codon:yes gene_type:complete
MAVISLSSLQISAPTSLNTSYVCGVTLTNGEVVYADSNNSNKLDKADCTTLAKASPVGIVLVPGADDTSTALATNNTLLKSTGTFSKGSWYYLSATSGDICLETDLTTNNYVTQIGYAKSDDELVVMIVKTGVQK